MYDIRQRIVHKPLQNLAEVSPDNDTKIHIFTDICDNAITILECGPMPNVMAALSNMGGVLCSTPQSLADARCWSALQ